MKIFITGGNGYIGSHLVAKLRGRGDEVICLLRDPSKATDLHKTGAQLVKGDITAPDSMRAAMRGADAVIHLAGMYKFGPKFIPQTRAINVDGARNVLTMAADLGVPKIIHTSTIGVFGNTHGEIVDESYFCDKPELGSEYELTKWEAHYEVAVPLQKQGAPVMILQPGAVMGAGDPSPHTQVMDFYLRRFPLGFGAKSGITVVHVDDCADGHIQALERGTPGETYITSGEAVTYKQMHEHWQKLCGIPAAKIWLPAWMVALNQKLLNLNESVGIHLPINAESLHSMQDYTFWATSDKARREIGWHTRPLDETFREALTYEMQKLGMKNKS